MWRAATVKSRLSGLFGDVLAASSQFGWDILHLRQTIFHGQHGLGVVDMDDGRERLTGDRRRIVIHQVAMRMRGHQMPTTSRAELAVTAFRLLEVPNMLPSLVDLDVTIHEERKDIDWSGGPLPAGFAVTVSHRVGIACDFDFDRSAKTCPFLHLGHY